MADRSDWQFNVKNKRLDTWEICRPRVELTVLQPIWRSVASVSDRRNTWTDVNWGLKDLLPELVFAPQATHWCRSTGLTCKQRPGRSLQLLLLYFTSVFSVQNPEGLASSSLSCIFPHRLCLLFSSSPVKAAVSAASFTFLERSSVLLCLLTADHVGRPTQGNVAEIKASIGPTSRGTLGAGATYHLVLQHGPALPPAPRPPRAGGDSVGKSDWEVSTSLFPS